MVSEKWSRNHFSNFHPNFHWPWRIPRLLQKINLSFCSFFSNLSVSTAGKHGWNLEERVKKVSPPQETPTDRPDGLHDKARAYFIYNVRLLLRNHLQRAPFVDGGAECGSVSVSPSPGTQDLGGKAVQCTQRYKWVINREREKKLNVVCHVGFVWGWVCPSPSSRNQSPPQNKVDELARGQVCCDIKVCTCYPAALALPDGPQKTPSTDQCSWSRLWHPAFVTQTSAFGNVRIRDAHLHKKEAQHFNSVTDFSTEGRKKCRFCCKCFLSSCWPAFNEHSQNISDAAWPASADSNTSCTQTL